MTTGTAARPTAVPGDTARRTLDEVVRDPLFRAWQAAWRRRIASSRRLEPLEDVATDPFAPSGRWS